MNTTINAVDQHPQWLAAVARRDTLTTELAEMRKREETLAGAVGNIPRARNVSAEAMELLGEAVPGTYARQLADDQAKRTDLDAVRARITVLEEALSLLDARMFKGTDGGQPLRVVLSREVCAARHPEHQRLVTAIHNAILALQSAVNAEAEFIDDLERGETVITGPIEILGRPIGDEMFARWLEHFAPELPAQPEAELMTV